MPLTTTDWPATPDATSLAFQKFDSSLGELTKVIFRLNGFMNTEITVTNNGGTSSSGDAHTRLRIYVGYPTVEFPTLSLGAPQIDISSDDFFFTNLAPGNSVKGTFEDIYFLATKQYTAANILAAFTGSGIITLDADTLTLISLSYDGGNTIAAQATKASIDSACVSYIYTPVPEPATIFLLTIGSVFFIKRKNSK
ncbi:MAG: PEP-CTERM sorting domain-containing protein [Phycisphaerae bacterium]